MVYVSAFSFLLIVFFIINNFCLLCYFLNMQVYSLYFTLLHLLYFCCGNNVNIPELRNSDSDTLKTEKYNLHFLEVFFVCCTGVTCVYTFSFRQKLDQLISGRLFGVLIVLL